MHTLHLHCLFNYWFCYENWKKLSASLFRREQIQNKETKMTNFIKVELESESESESDIELELKSELESDTE